MCVDPVTATAIAATASLAATAGQGVVGYYGGKQQEAEAKSAARQELLNTAITETQTRKESRKFAARQRVQALASGGDVSSGSLDEVQSADAATMELNALMQRYGGQTRAEGLKQQGRNAAKTGTIGMVSSFMQAGVEAIGSHGRGDFKAFGKKAA